MDIKYFRNQTDALLNTTRKLNSTREVSLSITNLQRAFSWLGLAFAAQGSQSPYVDSHDPKNPSIEPLADHDDQNFIAGFEIVDDTQTARVKFLREALRATIDEFEKWKNEVNFPLAGVEKNATMKYHLCLIEFFVSITDAKLWLGWELNRIHDAAESKQ